MYPVSVALFCSLILALILPAGCTEDKNPVGFDQGPRGSGLVTPETLLIAAPSADLEIRPDRGTGTSASLLVGTDDTAVARALIRFETLPDTTGLRYAYLSLYEKPGKGEAIGIIVQEIDAGADSWDPDSVRWETAPPVVEEPLDSFWPVGALPDTVDQREISRLEIPISLIREWKEDPESNAGLMISIDQAQAGEGLIRLVSHNDQIFEADGSTIRTPTIVFADSSNTDIVSAEATHDAYVIRDLRPSPLGVDPEAFISAAPTSRLALRFDLDSIPTGVSIVRGLLRLPLREGQLSEDDPVRLAVHRTTESWSEDSSYTALDIETFAVFLEDFTDPDLTTLETEIAPVVQAWLEGTENYGVTVRMADETSLPQAIELYTREGERNPSLEIVYLRPLDHRWGGAK